MAGARGGRTRSAVLGALLALSILLLGAAKADAGKYEVVQCGWGVGADADWWDSTGGAKFRSDAYCVPPGGDPFDGIHLKSFGRESAGTVSGTRFARWRWVAPPGTGITQVRGTWWHALHDGMEQRIGFGNAGGGFDPFLAAASTDTALSGFVKGAWPPQPALEDRLLCARSESRSCSLSPGSWSGIRALAITLQDDYAPAPFIMGGPLTEGGWRRGNQDVAIGADDFGGGVRFGETTLDGARVGLAEYGCEKASVGGGWVGTRMRPCPAHAWAWHTVATGSFSDGPHTLVHCATDFAGNGACAEARTVLVDNHAPVHPRNLALAGGDAWRRLNDFDLSWVNPDQGAASPIGGAYWRIAGPAGYDSGVKLAAGREIAALADRSLPRPGAFTLSLWLRDEAGNDSPPSAVEIPLRLDDVRPGLAFTAGDAAGVPQQVRAEVTDLHSGPASGAILYRRLNTAEWTELQTRFEAEAGAEKATLTASLPELAAGTYVFRADAADRAGNTASTTLRADGTEMAVRKAPPPVAPRRVAATQTKTRLFARLRGGHGRGDALTIPFGSPALLTGRLTRADGAGVAGRRLRVVARPSRGALTGTARSTAVTGERGGFELRLAPGPSRRITITFAGDAGLEPARRPSLELRVRSGVSLRAAPMALRTGDVVRLSGRVRTRGAPVPRRGKLVAIHYLEEATRRWRPVLVTRTDHGGRFRARYRFRYVSGAASIRLRATALAEERWPYAPGFSRPVTLLVRGR